MRGDATVRETDARAIPATEADWATEYLAPIISVKIVDGVGEAIAHIGRYGSHHTEAIVTEDPVAAERFLAEIDSAILLWNASTQFADGGEFGMGAEIGISTGKLHARGPVGVDELTSYKFQVRGTGRSAPDQQQCSSVTARSRRPAAAGCRSPRRIVQPGASRPPPYQHAGAQTPEAG